MNQRLELLGVPLHRQHDRPLFHAVGGGGHGGDDLTAVGEAETHGEGAVVAELDRLALEGDAGVRLGGAVDDELGVEVEEEAALAAARPGARTEARDGGRTQRPAEALLEELLELKAAGGRVVAA